jgi:hypothetical protein
VNRRTFVRLAAAGVSGLARAAARDVTLRPAAARRLLEPVDLAARIRLGQSALVGGLDSGQKHLPYWSCGFDRGDLRAFKHSGYQGETVWDRVHDVGRALHGLSLAESVTGQKLDGAIVDDLAGHLFATFAAGDGLPGWVHGETGKRTVNLHNVREALHGLTPLVARGSTEAAKLARQLVRTVRRALDGTGAIHLDRLPAYVEGYNQQPSGEGRAVDALVRYYRVSGDDVALETAALMIRFAFERCFTEAGALTDEAGTHGHSINALVAGILDFALLTGDAALLDAARRVFDVGLTRFNSSFGWSMESLHKFQLRGEANNTGDLLRASLLLGRAGHAEYFERAERILRSHLLPSQTLDVEGYSDDAGARDDSLRSLAARVRGGFAFPTPNDLQFKPDAPLFVYDVVSGAVDGLCQAYRAAVTEEAAAIRVALLFGIDTPALKVRSRLPAEGHVEIEASGGRNLLVRIPRWVARDRLVLEVGGERRDSRLLGSYLLVEGHGGPRRITVRFPVREERTVETIVYQRHTIDWRGDQIVAMSPPAAPDANMPPLPVPSIPMFPRCS